MVWMEKAHQEFLAEPLSKGEVTDAIDALDGPKAPGLDGFTGCFYIKKYKDILLMYIRRPKMPGYFHLP